VYAGVLASRPNTHLILPCINGGGEQSFFDGAQLDNQTA